MPSAKIAEVVTKAWCAALDLGSIRRDEDFFTLGGNSLLAVQLAERLEAELGIEFPIEAIFYGGRLSDIITACQTAGGAGG